MSTFELFWRDTPINIITSDKKYFIYAPSSSDKEDWFLLLRRAALQVLNNDNEAQHVEYSTSMRKLVSNLTVPIVTESTILEEPMDSMLSISQLNPHLSNASLKRLSKSLKDSDISHIYNSDRLTPQIEFKSDAWLNAIIGRFLLQFIQVQESKITFFIN